MQATSPRYNRLGILLILIGCLLILATPFVTAQDTNPDQPTMSVEEPLRIQGRVQQISMKKNIITIKPNKSGKIKIHIGEHTDLVNVSSLKELLKGQRVKVWYTTVGELNLAKKVVRLPDLGC